MLRVCSPCGACAKEAGTLTAHAQDQPLVRSCRSLCFSCSGVQKRWGRDIALQLLLLLILSSGMFTSSTTFLPSTFAMCAPWSYARPCHSMTVCPCSLDPVSLARSMASVPQSGREQTSYVPRYALTAGTAALLAGNQAGVIAAAVCGIMLGWVVAAVAFLPHALWVLLATPLAPAVCMAACGVSVVGSLLFAADYWFYGRFTVRLR